MKIQDWKIWKEYNLAGFAEALDISESFASLLLNGKRGTSPKMALRIEKATLGQVRKEELVWPEEG